MNLCEKDKQLARELRVAGVLGDITPQSLQLDQGVIIVACADGDQFFDRAEFLTTQLAKRVHFLSAHAGSLRMAESCPLNDPGSTMDTDLIKQISEANALKGISQVLLEMHAPCGKVLSHGLSFEEAIMYQLASKRRVREALPYLKFTAIVHMSWEDRKRYYHINSQRFHAYMFSGERTLPEIVQR